MNHIYHRKVRIAARNEGKIKSYESCIDVRAWSHDTEKRNSYLRDWIKCDMPICVVPVCTLSSILSIMTCSSRGRVTPRCYSRCQSKVLLDRLCSSCTVMRDCLSNNKEFEKYFQEEDLETLHWPCDKCLGILKNIKMFWKIVIEKVLKINLPKPNEFKSTHIYSIQNITKEWQKEIVKDAIFVKNNTHLTNQNIIKRKADEENEFENNRENKCLNNDCKNKATETDCEFRTIAVQTYCRSLRQKLSKCTSASIKVANPERKSHYDEDNEVIMLYKNNIQNLQQEFNVQKNEVDRLKKENVALNVELQRCRHDNPKNLYPKSGDQSLKTFDNTVAIVTSPFNSKEKFDNTPKDIDSEMVITLKNCKNENFRHVSVIQVLHKTNELDFSEINASYFKEDPIHLLNKVHETFEAMVNRELSIAKKTDKKFKKKNVVIKSTFRNIGESKSDPSCSTSSYSLTSEANFESANETITIRSGK